MPKLYTLVRFVTIWILFSIQFSTLSSEITKEFQRKYFKTISDGSIVEGSARHGGMQPDFIYDSSHPMLAKYREFLQTIKHLPIGSKIKSIQDFIRNELLPNRKYEHPAYIKLMKEYKDLGREVSIGEYAKIKAGTCREYAMLTHFGLKEVGIENFYIYIKDEDNEDHALNVIKHNDDFITVDNFLLDYSGRKLEELYSNQGVNNKSYRAEWGKIITHKNSKPKIMSFNKFPRIHNLKFNGKIPRNDNSIKLKPIKIKLGPELTFSNEKMMNANWLMANGDVTAIRDENRSALMKYKQQILKRCKKIGCTVTEQWHEWGDGWKTPQFKVTYPDGWWFIADLDTAVLEFQSKEMTLEHLKKLMPRMKRDIFGLCKKIGLTPRSGVGGGHIHIDLASAFPEDGKLLRDFIVDYANHSGLSYGPLTKENGNATPIAKLRSDQKIAFRKVIQDFDRGNIRTRDGLAEAIQKRVYFWSPSYASPPEKYVATNLTRILNELIPMSEKTVEIRGIRAQKSPFQLFQIGLIFESRLNYLQNRKTAPQIGSLEAPKNNLTILKHFNSYLEESGLRPNEFKDLLPVKFKALYKNASCLIRKTAFLKNN